MEPTATDQSAPGIDPFLKRYLTILGLLVLAGVAYWVANQDSRVSELNEMLAQAPTLADYPYQFRVLSLSGGIAVVSSPRSAERGPMHFLRVLDASLNDKDVLHPDMMAAQDLLAQKQSEAARLIEAEPDVEGIRWELDERWYAEHGIFLPD